MSDIRIRREHSLGLSKARKIAWQWAEEVEQKFGMACSVVEGETSDTVAFKRTGVHGELIVAPDHFDLVAHLGFLLSAFSKRIESEIQGNLDALLAKEARPGRAASAASGRAAAKRAAHKGKVK